ncbi:MAG: superoxide dismutase [Verrucomicrobiota bacterium]|jgi:Fe-Mn family superoxide dismutase
MMTRRQALKTAGLAATACAIGSALQNGTAPSAAAEANSASGPFTLPPLPYPFDALEPNIDARTMEIHHNLHHAGYVANLNKAVAEFPELGKKSVADLLKDLNSVPEKIRTAVRNQGGGHHNHSLFWQMMSRSGGGEPQGELAQAIEKAFGGFAAFKSKFSEAAAKVFGSGWAWLAWAEGDLRIETTPNQDSLLSQGGHPLLGLDVWEHAYYLKYQNRRPEYIGAFWKVVSWDFVADRYAKRRA